jgi:Xaa-Pro aminopeptidase
MISETALADAQTYLREHGLDGWLVYDFQHGNPVFYQVVGGKRHTTRRCFLLIRPDGPPEFLLHQIDAPRLADLGWSTRTYLGLADMDVQLRALLGRAHRLAMEYSPDCALPVVSRVDAGMVEHVRSLGAEVTSSADLLQFAVSRWTPSQLEMHRSAARKLADVVREAFAFAGRNAGKGATEADVVSHMRELYARVGLVTEEGPVVAVDAHSGDPHYEPTPAASAPVLPGQWVLIDLWAKEAAPDAVYADMTWVGFIGDVAPARQQDLFLLVRDARDLAIQFMADRYVSGEPVQGWEVDAVARQRIEAAGYGPYFTHRLGHSLGQAVHSNGANLDGFETRDTRTLIPGVSVTVEPGVYLPEFGVRTEVDVYFGPGGPEVTTPRQESVVLAPPG